MGTDIPAFEWDDANRRHIAKHNITPEEVQQAVLDPHAVLLEIQFSDGEERTKALGVTASGRVLSIVFTFRRDAIRPITSYSAPARLQELYSKLRGA